MMLAYFARPYDDELLSSWMCRCARHLLLTTEQFAHALGLRRRSVCGSFGLSNNLDEVAASISRFYSWSGPELVERFTLLPYFTAFMADDKKAGLTAELCSSAKTSIAINAGITMSSSSQLRERRFCASCVATELVQLGESYWHRSHQLPAVCVCHIHIEPLRVSRYRYGDPSANSHSALPQDEDGVQKNVASRVRVAHEIAKLSSGLLAYAPAALTQVEYALKYRTAIAAAGLVYHDGRIHSRKLRTRMEELFGAASLEEMGCVINRSQSWMAMMLMPAYQWRFSPVKHILMQIFTAQLPVPADLSGGSVLALAVLRGDALIPSVPLTHTHGTGGRKVHDWEAKDEKLLHDLKRHHAELQASLRPGIQVTKTMLIRKVGCVGPIKGRPDMLPKCIKFLAENCPSAGAHVCSKNGTATETKSQTFGPRPVGATQERRDASRKSAVRAAQGQLDASTENSVGSAQERIDALGASWSGAEQTRQGALGTAGGADELSAWHNESAGLGLESDAEAIPALFMNASDGAYRWRLCEARAELIAQLCFRHLQTKFAALPELEVLGVFYKKVSEANTIFSVDENLWTIRRSGELFNWSGVGHPDWKPAVQ